MGLNTLIETGQGDEERLDCHIAQLITRIQILTGQGSEGRQRLDIWLNWWRWERLKLAKEVRVDSGDILLSMSHWASSKLVQGGEGRQRWNMVQKSRPRHVQASQGGEGRQRWQISAPARGRLRRQNAVGFQLNAVGLKRGEYIAQYMAYWYNASIVIPCLADSTTCTQP